MKETALIRFEGYELDPRARSLTLDGARIALSPKSLDLLLYLAEHPHEVISKDRLLSAVWPDSFVEESNLSQHVFLVRKALAASGHGERIVITIPGKGYQFAAPVEVVSPRSPQTSAPVGTLEDIVSRNGGLRIRSVRNAASFVLEEEVDDSQETALKAPASLKLAAPVRRSRWTLWACGLGLLLSCVAGLGLWRWMHPPAAGPLHVVLAAVENATHDRDFDRTLNEALEIDLQQSPYLNLLSKAAIGETLATMQKPVDFPLQTPLAREVCERNNAEVVPSGTLSQIGSL